MASIPESEPIRYHRVGDLILNNRTKRAIKVGGRAFNDLVRKGVVFGPYVDPRVLAHAPDDEEDLENKMQELNATLPHGVHAVRGRGVNAGKIVKRAKPITGLDATRYTVKVAAQAVAAHVNEICEEEGDDADMIGLVERLILAEMTQSLRIAPVKRAPGRPRKDAEEKYIEAPVPEEPDSEEEPETKQNPKIAPFRPATKSTRGGSIMNNARKAILEQKEAAPTETEPETETAIEESEVPEGESDEGDDAWADEPENWDE